MTAPHNVDVVDDTGTTWHVQHREHRQTALCVHRGAIFDAVTGHVLGDGTGIGGQRGRRRPIANLYDTAASSGGHVVLAARRGTCGAVLDGARVVEVARTADEAQRAPFAIAAVGDGERRAVLWVSAPGQLTAAALTEAAALIAPTHGAAGGAPVTHLSTAKGRWVAIGDGSRVAVLDTHRLALDWPEPGAQASWDITELIDEHSDTVTGQALGWSAGTLWAHDNGQRRRWDPRTGWRHGQQMPGHHDGPTAITAAHTMIETSRTDIHMWDEHSATAVTVGLDGVFDEDITWVATIGTTLIAADASRVASLTRIE